MNSSYKILALVDLQHDYYADGQSRDFSVMASPDCANTVRGMGIVYKVVGNKLAVLIRVDNTGKPLATFLPHQQLCFYLLTENPHFYNITNVNFQPSAPKRYYFNNLKNNKPGGKLFLTEKVPLYSSANNYPIGTLAASAGNDVYEAIRASNSGNVHGLGDTAYWVKKGSAQYANDSDLIELSDRIYTFKMTASDTNFLINVYKLDADSGNYDLEALPAVAQTFLNMQSSVQVKLDGIPAGRYLIDVNGEQKLIYFDPAAIYNEAFGIIELYNHLPGTDDFALLDVAGVVKESDFIIRFANRSVIWKYFATGDITAITDGGGSYSFSPGGGNKFFHSNQPIPLREKPISSLSLTSVKFGSVDTLANPGIDRLTSFLLSGETYYCVEKYLNY